MTFNSVSLHVTKVKKIVPYDLMIQIKTIVVYDTLQTMMEHYQIILYQAKTIGSDQNDKVKRMMYCLMK